MFKNKQTKKVELDESELKEFQQMKQFLNNNPTIKGNFEDYQDSLKPIPDLEKQIDRIRKEETSELTGPLSDIRAYAFKEGALWVKSELQKIFDMKPEDCVNPEYVYKLYYDWLRDNCREKPKK